MKRETDAMTDHKVVGRAEWQAWIRRHDEYV